MGWIISLLLFTIGTMYIDVADVDKYQIVMLHM